MPRGGSNGAWTLPKRWRTAENAKQASPETVYREGSDVASRAEFEGIKEGRELLERIRKAGSNRRALAACRFGRDS